MPTKRRNRVVLAAVLGLEVGLLAWGVVVFVGLVFRGQRIMDRAWQLPILAGAMILIYILYLKKEREQVQELVVGEKVRTGALLEALPAAAMLVDGAGTVLAANSRAAAALGVEELRLIGSGVAEAVGGDLGGRLAAGSAGSFVAESPAGGRLRCTATPVETGREEQRRTRLVILEPAGGGEPARSEGATAAAPAGAGAASAADKALRGVVELLERTGEHLARLSAAERCDGSPGGLERGASLAGVAVRLSQAARRVRLAGEFELILGGRLKAALARERFDLCATAREVVGSVQPLFVATGIDLAAEVPAEPLAAESDARRVKLVLRDLLEASLAMTAPGGRVALRLARGEGEAELEVSDNGCGVAREAMEALFEATGSAPVQEVYSGGIRDGLFAAREIVEACGGRLWAESAPGRGTRFSLRLPLA